MTETIVCEKRDRVAVIRMNRPEALNARNSQMRAELLAAFQDSNDDGW